VSLVPLAIDHADDLLVAANEDRGSYGFTFVPHDFSTTLSYLEGLLCDQQSGETVPFAQIDNASGYAIGVTRYLTIRCEDHHPTPYAVEIGGTWLGASAQRTAINTQAKLLLLDFAFGEWGVARVDLKSDVRNKKSRAGIERIGAQFEGVLRNWQRSQVVGEEEQYRETAMYSIIAAEWPEVRTLLKNRL
jgi:RimJ/RimL family protein N-acetyltransferase